MRSWIGRESRAEVVRDTDVTWLRVQLHLDPHPIAGVDSCRRLHGPIDDDVPHAVVDAGSRAPGVTANRYPTGGRARPKASFRSNGTRNIVAVLPTRSSSTVKRFLATPKP